MKVNATVIPEVKLIQPSVFRDERGFFFESYNQKQFDDAIGYAVKFVQDNHSRSIGGVLRGLHYQLPPYEQGKLVRVVQGEIFDVAVDLRKDSPTCGKWVCAILSSKNKTQVWIPAGFAHGFLSLSASSEVIYKATAFYTPEYERSICWDDPDLAIEWPSVNRVFLSPKDSSSSSFRDAELF